MMRTPVQAGARTVSQAPTPMDEPLAGDTQLGATSGGTARLHPRGSGRACLSEVAEAYDEGGSPAIR
jgi:hypothetical protein